jgi:hypothetical protein
MTMSENRHCDDLAMGDCDYEVTYRKFVTAPYRTETPVLTVWYLLEPNLPAFIADRSVRRVLSSLRIAIFEYRSGQEWSDFLRNPSSTTASLWDTSFAP